MTCEAIRDLLSLYIDGELDADTAANVEAHLRTCAECSVELEALKRAIELCGALDELEVPSGFRASVMAKAAERGFLTRADEPVGVGSAATNPGRKPGKVSILSRLFGSGQRQALALAAATLVVIVGVNSAMGTLDLPWSSRKSSSQMRNSMPAPAATPAASKPAADLAGSGSRGMATAPAPAPAPSSTPTAQKAMAPMAPTESKGKIMAADASSSYDMTDTVERQIIRRASLQLETGKERFDEISRQVVLMTESMGGFVQDSSVFTEADGKRIANFSIRVPEGNFTKLLTQVESYGKIVNRSMGSQDVTEQTIDLDAQLTNYERQQARLLELLGKAKNLDEILRIESELNRVRSMVDSLKSRLKYLKNAVSMSTVQVTLRESAAKIVPQEPNVLRDMWQAFMRSVRSVFIFLGELAPFLIAGWFIWFLVVTYRKK